MILFLPVQCTAPLPKRNRIRAVTDIVPRHSPHFAPIEDVVVAGPVHPAWLSLHHPEVSPKKPSREVVRGPSGYGVEMP